MPARAPLVSPRTGRKLLGVPLNVIVLGIVSFFTDVSSEMIFAVLPLFLTVALGASPATLGAMEGLADFAASSLDLPTGYLSDHFGRRKPFAVLGYGLSSASKVLLVWATRAPIVVAFRIADRLGKSIRGVPRDALLSSTVAEAQRGLAFGVHKALDKSGAIVGPLIAYAFLDRYGHSLGAFHTLFVAALVPAAASLGLLLFFVREARAPERSFVRPAQFVSSLGLKYRHYVVSAGLFSLAYFSLAFLLLAAFRAGFATKDVALLYALFNVSFVAASVPVGRLSDRIGRRPMIAASYALYAMIAIGFATLHARGAVIALFILYGVFFAIDEAQPKAYVSDLTPSEMRASAIGAYGFVTALAYLPASLVIGALWTAFGPGAAFGTAALVSTSSLGYFLVFDPDRPSRAA